MLVLQSVASPLGANARLVIVLDLDDKVWLRRCGDHAAHERPRMDGWRQRRRLQRHRPSWPLVDVGADA